MLSTVICIFTVELYYWEHIKEREREGKKKPKKTQEILVNTLLCSFFPLKSFNSIKIYFKPFI